MLDIGSVLFAIFGGGVGYRGMVQKISMGELLSWGGYGDGKGLEVRRRDSSATPRNDTGKGGRATAAGQPLWLPLHIGGFAGDGGWG